MGRGLGELEASPRAADRLTDVDCIIDKSCGSGGGGIISHAIPDKNITVVISEVNPSHHLIFVAIADSFILNDWGTGNLDRLKNGTPVL